MEFVNQYAEFGLDCEKISDSEYNITLNGEVVDVFVDDRPGEYIVTYSNDWLTTDDDGFRPEDLIEPYTRAVVLYKDGKPCGVDFKTVTP